ncbi:MAG: hypothetical protein ACKVP7_17235 [Hyphomicrobiaceae bacterium]
MIEQVLTFTEWKRELVALLKIAQIRPTIQGVWRRFHAIGYTPADAFEFVKECSEITAIMRAACKAPRD